MGGVEKETTPPRRFRFVAAGVTEDSLKDLIKLNWRNEENWSEAMSSLTMKIKEQNNAIFGNINKRKRNLASRLNGIDEANSKGVNLYLNQL